MSQIHLNHRADDLQSAALAFSKAADCPGASAALGGAVTRLQETLRVLSASLYTLADDAVPELAQRRRLGAGARVEHASGLSREQEIRVVSTIHDLGAALSCAARSCEAVREVAVPTLASAAAEQTERMAASHTRADGRPATSSVGQNVALVGPRGSEAAS
jgi:hypothetical protein